ncbi:hypothetical protein RCL1_005351 [Eukaryota sp. TZLM3-RCL]
MSYEQTNLSQKLGSANLVDKRIYSTLIETGSTSSVRTSSYLLSVVPRKYGFDEEFVTGVRMRLRLNPRIIFCDSICLCGQVATLDHVLCCSHFNQKRTIFHDALISEVHSLWKSVGIVASIEPLLKNLVADATNWKTKSRGDLHIEWKESRQLIIDATIVFCCSSTKLEKSVDCATQLIASSENDKINKYKKIISSLNQNRSVKLEFLPSAVSLLGRLGSRAEQFFSELEQFIKKRGRTFYSIHVRQMRFVFVFEQKDVYVS